VCNAADLARLRRADEARFDRVWLGTTKPQFFARFGFAPFSRWDLPLVVLLGKLPGVFRQPVARWPGALFGQFAYLRRDRVVVGVGAPSPAISR
jgi:hypothetical protein